jgi:hypothetical protein
LVNPFAPPARDEPGTQNRKQSRLSALGRAVSAVLVGNLVFFLAYAGLGTLANGALSGRRTPKGSIDVVAELVMLLITSGATILGAAAALRVFRSRGGLSPPALGLAPVATSHTCT